MTRAPLSVRLFAIAGAVAALVVPAPLRAQNHDPERARLVMEDIPRFWSAFDARGQVGTTRALDSLYFAPGTRGMKDWIGLRLKSAADMARTVDRFATFYEAARPLTLRVIADSSTFRTVFRALDKLLPGAVFPDVYFLIGRLSTGGTTSGAGLLIGADMYARVADSALMATLPAWQQAVMGSADEVPAIVAHELVHYQQKGKRNNLLGQALYEGTADFVSEMIAGRSINQLARAYGLAHERDLWVEFSAVMSGSKMDGFLYNGGTSTTRPADLGYFIGYRIAQAYWERAIDKGAALRTLLDVRDPEALLRESGYAERFTP
jgi:hypothetical protein